MIKNVFVLALGAALVFPIYTDGQTNFTRVTTGDIVNDQGGFAVGAWAGQPTWSTGLGWASV